MSILATILLNPSTSFQSVKVEKKILEEASSQLEAQVPKQKTNPSWWVIIHTTIPECTYYFGPFGNREEAKSSQLGYVEDLLEEQAQGLEIVIERCQPTNLTITTTSVFKVSMN